MPSPTLPPAFSKGGRRSRLLHMPPTHNPLRLFGCTSRANKPSQNSQQSAAHASPEASTNWERKGACVLCFVFVDVNPKSVQKGAALAPMHSVTLCVRVCSCGWCPNTVKLLFVCGWWPNTHRQSLVPGAQRANAQPFAFRSPPPPPLDCSSQRHSATTTITIPHLPPPAA